MVIFWNFNASTTISINGPINSSFSLIGQFWPISGQLINYQPCRIQYLWITCAIYIQKIVFLIRTKPFDELCEDELCAVMLVLKEVSKTYTYCLPYSPYRTKFNGSYPWQPSIVSGESGHRNDYVSIELVLK